MDVKADFNPGPAEPRYALPLQTVQILAEAAKFQNANGNWRGLNEISSKWEWPSH